MMNSFFWEFLIKERQRQISDEFERIHMARTANRTKAGLLRKMSLRLSEVFIVAKTRSKRHHRPSVTPEVSERDACCTEGPINPKTSML